MPHAVIKQRRTKRRINFSHLSGLIDYLGTYLLVCSAFEDHLTSAIQHEHQNVSVARASEHT